jgi:hypothetical protein
MRLQVIVEGQTYRLLNEDGPINPQALHNYVRHLATEPQAHWHDLQALARLLNRLAEENPQAYAHFADMWPTIKQLIAKLPPAEQAQALDTFSVLKFKGPHYERSMRFQGLKHFTSLEEFEKFIYAEMGEVPGNPTQLMKLLQDPVNEHFWLALDDAAKRDVVEWLQECQTRQEQQPNFGTQLRQMMSQLGADPETDGLE